MRNKSNHFVHFVSNFYIGRLKLHYEMQGQTLSEQTIRRFVGIFNIPYTQNVRDAFHITYG